jgi:hypothetical protein
VARGQVEDPNFFIPKAIITEGDATPVEGKRRIMIAHFPRTQLLFGTYGCAAARYQRQARQIKRFLPFAHDELATVAANR